MKNIVLIPCFNRPEYLSICLEHIQQADNWQQYKYLFAFDVGGDKKCLDIIRQFKAETFITTPKDQGLKLGKQSFNVISGLVAAANMTDGLVFYIEDDVFIGKDFFTFTEAIHEQEPEIFETILSGNVNSKEEKVNDLNAYYVKENHNVHQGIGNCIKAKMIKDYILPHYTMNYFRFPLDYVQTEFPQSQLSKFFSEQDGLIRRIIEKNQLKVAFSHVPRCFHAGMYGYNRFTKMNHGKMDFNQRVKFIKEYAFDVKKLASIATAQNLIDDSVPVDLDTEHTGCYLIETHAL